MMLRTGIWQSSQPNNAMYEHLAGWTVFAKCARLDLEKFIEVVGEGVALISEWDDMEIDLTKFAVSYDYFDERGKLVATYGELGCFFTEVA
ncbi:hypothetical protein PIB30_027781 [Stylosanthes scabra]|uniref:Uncharacterized protein n=1 Tax=Stylosanthes scabra TaxID=79078 RepID=A0ABU6QA85_9FABA|nr:hypothetical protein [Stylosanthes scabra]